MKTKVKSETRSFVQFNKRAGAGLFALMLLLPVVARGGGVVANCTEADLRAAMAGGGLVTFACDGTITLTNTITITENAVLDATGHQITISGSNAVQVFSVASNVTFTAVSLTIANGRSEFGAGINNLGSIVNLLGTVLQTNVALAAAGRGGALCNWGGVINASNCGFYGNVAQSLTNSQRGEASGGAVFNPSGSANLQNCVFDGNTASAAFLGAFYQPSVPVVAGSNGCGGAIYNLGSLNASSCTFRGNSASGGMGGEGTPANPYVPSSTGSLGGDGGFGCGGAVFNSGSAMLTASTFVGNRVIGGTGGYGGYGVMPFFSSVGTPGGRGGFGGPGSGAAIFNQGVAQLGNCTVVSNQCVGGTGGAGGHGGDGRDHTVGGDGGDGGTGGNGFGNLYGSFYMTNCTVAFDSALGGAGGAGGAGGTVPGGPPYAYPGDPGNPGTNGSAFGGMIAGGSSLLNTLLATNAPGGNSSRTLTDLGHNLSSDASCNFTNLGSLNNTDPRLGPLTDNGGPTPTMALLPGSPAIDGGSNTGAPASDQRGFPRLIGHAADIGAYEYCYLPVLRATLAQAGIINVTLFTTNDQTCRLLTSSDLVSWQCVATNQIGPDGTVLFQDNCGAGEIQRFYRVAIP